MSLEDRTHFVQMLTACLLQGCLSVYIIIRLHKVVCWHLSCDRTKDHKINSWHCGLEHALIFRVNSNWQEFAMLLWTFCAQETSASQLINRGLRHLQHMP